ncbi:MAG: HEAT repeat domain-containing protein [Candidatus Sericytochromatia bacterium]
MLSREAFDTALAERRPAARDALLTRLRQAGEAGPAAWLLEALAHPDAQIAMQAAYLLGGLGIRSARAALESQLALGHPYVASEAARALGRLGDPAAVPALLDALGSPHGFVVGPAVHALVKLRATEALPRIRALVGHDNVYLHEQAEAAIRVLEAMPPSA